MTERKRAGDISTHKGHLELEFEKGVLSKSQHYDRHVFFKPKFTFIRCSVIKFTTTYSSILSMVELTGMSYLFMYQIITFRKIRKRFRGSNM